MAETRSKHSVRKRNSAESAPFSRSWLVRKAASLLRNLVQDGLVEARGATRARVYKRRG